MGWFDNEKILVDVLATKLTDDEVTPLKNAVISNTVRDAGVSDGILAGMLNGLGARAHRYYKYGESDKWSGELPVVEVGLINEGDPYELEPYPGTFYPVPTLRENREWLTAESDEIKHKETKQLVKRVAINIDNIIENIQDPDREDEEGNPVEGENPSENLDDVFFLFGLDLYTQQEKSAEYMFDFWKNTEPVIKQDWDAFQQGILDFQEGGLLGEIITIPANVIVFNGASQHTLHYVFDAVTSEEISGTLLDEEGKEIDASAEVIKGPMKRYEYDPEDSPAYYYIDSSYVEYRKQIEEGVIGIIQVHGIHHETLVDAYGENNVVVRTISDPSQAEPVEPVEPENPDVPDGPDNFSGTEQPVVQDFGDTGTYDTYFGLVPGDPDFGRSGMYIPLCFEVLELQNPIQEEKVLADAMMIVMHAAQEVELKWYQQGWFKVIMVIIVAAIIYFSLGRLFKEGMTLLSVVTELAIQVGLAFIVDLLVKHVDGELGLILAVAVAGYAASRGNFTKAQALLPAAKEILIAAQAVGSVAKADIEHKAAGLEAEIEDFTKSVKERKDDIHEAALLLGDPVAEIDLLDLVFNQRSAFTHESSPDNWLKQVKGMKNAAPLVKENISMYHSRMKELPRVAREDATVLA